MRSEDVSFLSILQKKLKYEQRLTESSSDEIEKSENVSMNNTDDAVKSSIRESVSNIQSREMNIIKSCDQSDNQVRKYQEASVRDTEMTQVREMFNHKN